MDQPVLIVDGDGIVEPNLVTSFRESPGNRIYCVRDDGDEPIYSYVEVDNNNRVLQIAEKQKLSPLACIGVYGFEHGDLLQKAAKIALESTNRTAGECYISHVVQILLEERELVQAVPVQTWTCLGTPDQLKSWCRRQLLLSNLKRDHATLAPVQAHPTFKMPLLERKTIERETGYYLPPASINRPWHKFKIDSETVTKSGPRGGLDYEAHWYRNLPRILACHSPNLLSHSTTPSMSSITIDRVHGVPFSHLLAEDILTEPDLQALLKVISEFHDHQADSLDPLPTGTTIYDNYWPKISQRAEQYPALADATDCIQKIYEHTMDYKMEGRGQESLIHGDPVFTNVLLTASGSAVLIDPRGHLNGHFTLRGDANYDLAKVYQSLSGYDAILFKRARSPRTSKLLTYYEEWLVSKIGSVGLQDIRWITASLYFSLIPMHEEQFHRDFLIMCRHLLKGNGRAK